VICVSYCMSHKIQGYKCVCPRRERNIMERRQSSVIVAVSIIVHVFVVVMSRVMHQKERIHRIVHPCHETHEEEYTISMFVKTGVTIRRGKENR
jgi:hypothetical protein